MTVNTKEGSKPSYNISDNEYMEFETAEIEGYIDFYLLDEVKRQFSKDMEYYLEGRNKDPDPELELEDDPVWYVGKISEDGKWWDL